MNYLFFIFLSIFIKFFKNVTLQNWVTSAIFSSKWHIVRGVGKSHGVSCFIEEDELPRICPMLWHSANTVTLRTCHTDHRKGMSLWWKSKQFSCELLNLEEKREFSECMREQNGTSLMNSLCSYSLSFMSTIESRPVSSMTDPFAWATSVRKRQMFSLELALHQRGISSCLRKMYSFCSALGGDITNRSVFLTTESFK